MLNNIKSKYILKLILSFAEEKTKFKIIKYNKQLQNKLDMTIVTYRTLSGKYIVYEDNNIGKKKGKEYDINDNILYEGEFLNGERNGKGKEYNYSFCFNKTLVIFEGEYLHGKRNDKGKEISYFNKILFKGEFLNGCKWNGKIYDIENNNIYEIKNGCGYFKEFDCNHVLRKEGEYLNGKLIGNVKEYHHSFDINDKLAYKGDYLYGIKNGKGIEYSFTNGEILFVGEYLNGKKWNGKLYNQFNNDEVFEITNGRGMVKLYTFGNKIIYEGEFLNGEKGGHGKLFDNKGDI